MVVAVYSTNQESRIVGWSKFPEIELVGNPKMSRGSRTDLLILGEVSNVMEV